MDNPICENCKWFKRYKRDTQSGHCHRDPPRSQGYMLHPEKEMPVELVWFWPTVSTDDFCPDWKSRFEVVVTIDSRM